MRAARARGDGHAGLGTINATFLNRQLAPEPEAGPFGVCFVAFSGTHNRRYRGERLLEVAATQMRAASPSTKLCVVTDQPHKPRRFVDLVLPLPPPPTRRRTSRNAPSTTSLRRGGVQALFGYMAKAIAVMQSPYATTLWLDTDTFLCRRGRAHRRRARRAGVRRGALVAAEQPGLGELGRAARPPRRRRPLGAAVVARVPHAR